MYVLISEDLTSLGAMGSRTTTNWRKYFKSLVSAKAFAEKDYGEPIKWGRSSRNAYCSGDLRYVMYTIHQVHTED